MVKTEGIQERVFEHIGTKTWFWKVEIATLKTSVEAIIICHPFDNSESLESGIDYIYSLYEFKEVESSRL